LSGHHPPDIIASPDSSKGVEKGTGRAAWMGISLWPRNRSSTDVSTGVEGKT
jgi:hypothetical protein